MKGLRRKQQGSYDFTSSTPETRPTGGASCVVPVTAGPSSRQVTLQDILDLASTSSRSGHLSANTSQHLDPCDLDFESSRVIVVNTKGSRRAPRKRSLSVSPRLGSRTSEAGSSCGSVTDAGAGGSGRAGGFYTWMQSSLRRRLRKRPKKSTLPRQQTPQQLPPAPACSCTQPPTPPVHRRHHDYANHPPRPDHLERVGTTLEREEVVTSSPTSRDGVVSPAATSPSHSPTPPVSSPSHSHSSPSSSYLSCSSGTCSPTTPTASCRPPSPPSPSTPPSSREQRTQYGGDSERSDPVTYVNHRNGSVTAVTAASILHALTSASSGAKNKLLKQSSSSSGSGNVGRGGSARLSHSTRNRSTSVGRRVALSTSVSNGTPGKKGGKGSKKKKTRVLGGAWGLFHCAGAGARSRSCTPERNVNYRVRSRSATPERYINVRVNPPPPTAGGAGKAKSKGKGLSMKGRSKTKSKSSRRRYSADSDDEGNKENKYDMWGFIKERLEWSGSGHRPCAAERLSRRDTLLTCRPRGSVNINRDRGVVDFSPPDLPAVTRSSSERRYDQPPLHHHPLPPQDTCTYIHRVPPTTDVNFNNYGSVLSVHLKRGETLPLNLQKCTSGENSVGSSLTSVASSKDSGVGGSSFGGSSRGGSGRGDNVTGLRERTSTLPARYRNRPLPPIPKPELPPKPPESGIHLVKTLKLDKFMKNKWISGVSVTRKNDLVVVDLKEAYLIDEDGNLKRTIGGSGKGALKEPIDVSVMANGNVAFSDHADQEVKVFTTKGQFVRRVMDKCLANIAGVATTGSGRMYIAGTDKRCITVHSEEDGYLYSIPSTSGNASGMYGTTSGSGATTSGSGIATTLNNKEMFEHPYSIAVNPLTGDVIVGDDYKQRVVALSPDGRVLWRYSPTGDRHFFPCSIAVDSEGYIFIADLYNEKVYMLDSSGKHLKVLLSRGEGLKGGPGAIAVDGRGHLVVADEERTLRVFKYGDKGFALYRRFSMCPDAK